MKKFALTSLLAVTILIIYSQEYTEWDSETVDEFYAKIELPYGSINEYGLPVNVVYVPTDPPENGTYEIEITDDVGDLYQIKGTELYIRFLGYHGYAGYGEEGILEVSSYRSTYYENPN